MERDKHGGLLLLSTQKQLYGTQPLLSVHIIQKGRREKGHTWIIRWTKTQELGCCSGTWEEANEYARKKNKGEYIILE